MAVLAAVAALIVTLLPLIALAALAWAILRLNEARVKSHRRNLPKFSRPSVELSTDAPRRTWKWVTMGALVQGDTVANLGTISEPPYVQPDGRVVLFNALGEPKDSHPDVLAWAHTAAETCGKLPEGERALWDTRCALPPHDGPRHVSARLRWTDDVADGS